ncbi:MAG: hypothetical protein LBT00_14305 [Spirochaetaceae bacterium]|nr:hypothetical protein [Spirochaetaceae bacterium]
MKQPQYRTGTYRFLSEAAPSLRGTKRRSNPDGDISPLDCFAPLAMTTAQARNLSVPRRGVPLTIRPRKAPAGGLGGVAGELPR